MNKRRLFATVSLVLISSTLLVACNTKNDDTAKNRSSETSRTNKSSSSTMTDKTSSGTGNSQKRTSSSSKTEQNSSSSSQTVSTNQSLNEATAVWSQSKASQLKDYILKEWGPALGQTYKEYGPNNAVNYYGLSLPSDLLNSKLDQTMTADFSGRKPNLVWSTDGEPVSGQDILVAIYSDIEVTGESMKSHLYLFTIDDGGNPEIWFTEQNQGNDSNRLYFRPTENQALRDKFFMLIKQ